VNRFVRLATVGDASAIEEVAAAAWKDTYALLLRPETIDRFLANAYSRATIVRRIERDTFLVADVDDTVRAFADAVGRDAHVALAAIYAAPSWRGHGLGRLLLEDVRRRHPDQPIVADVLEGNRLGEAFYERSGFVPRERIETELFGEAVVERRWWLGGGPSA
jgi:GNAT superfamily N-acetyltransferase